MENQKNLNEVEVEEIEGYALCQTLAQRCAHDCFPLHNQIITVNR